MILQKTVWNWSNQYKGGLWAPNTLFTSLAFHSHLKAIDRYVVWKANEYNVRDSILFKHKASNTEQGKMCNKRRLLLY